MARTPRVTTAIPGCLAVSLSGLRYPAIAPARRRALASVREFDRRARMNIRAGFRYFTDAELDAIRAFAADLGRARRGTIRQPGVRHRTPGPRSSARFLRTMVMGLMLPGPPGICACSRRCATALGWLCTVGSC